MSTRLLLINPEFAESFWSFKWAVDEVLPGKRAVNSPLGLTTLAALCPPHWDVEIADENIEPAPLAAQADIIGVCGMQAQFGRQHEPGASGAPGRGSLQPQPPEQAQHRHASEHVAKRYRRKPGARSARAKHRKKQG